MSDTINYITKSGLPCVFIKRKGFQNKFVGIGTRFGGAYQKVYKNQKEYKLKSGLAHFLEHKTFTMSDGSDCLELFLDMNAESNASTSQEQTCYYFTTYDSIEDPLRLLIDMFFTKGYKKSDVETEKNIILQELESTFDEVDFRIEDICIKTLYPNDSYSIDALGTKEDILSITKEDLDFAHDLFYTPKNSFLVVVGDIDENHIIKILEDSLSKYKFNDFDLKIEKTYSSKEPLKPRIIYEDIPYPELHVLGRIDSLNNKSPILTNILIALFDNLFSVEAKFFKKLQKEDLLLSDDIENLVSTHEFGSYFHLCAFTNNPNYLVKLVIDKIKNFSLNDFNSKISLATIKCYICDHIRAKDSIFFIGDDTLNLGLEGNSYQKEEELLLNLKEEDLIKYIDYIKNALLTYVIVFPKNVK